MNRLVRTIFIFSVLCLPLSGLFAQSTQLQVVSQTIVKKLPYDSDTEVNIEGQNAEIVVESWDQQEVKVVIEIISKHPDRAVAQRDLAAMKFKIDQHGKMIYFRNFISPDEGQPKPEASLKAIYTVTLPADCPLYLKNYFGVASVSNLSNFLRLQAEFTSIFLENLRGKIDVKTHFGDIQAQGLAGQVSIDASRSDLTLRELAGDFDIKSRYGIIKLFTDQSLIRLNIEAEKSDVYFFDPEPGAYGYSLTAHYGTITTPSDLKFNYIENSSTIKKAVFTPSKEMATVSIKISFGDIIIRNP